GLDPPPADERYCFTRPSDITHSTSVLRLEFLLRAPLAQVHPALLAESGTNRSDSIMDAAGFPTGGSPKSVPTTLVISRLNLVVPGFKERAADAGFLVKLRNAELHSSQSALAIDQEKWLPRFVRVVDVLCSHLGTTAQVLVGTELIAHGQRLVDAQDARLRHEVAQRIDAARAFFNTLDEAALAARRALRHRWFLQPVERVECPACGSPARLLLDEVRATNERLVENDVHRDVVHIAKDFSCQICELRLTGTEEIHAAGLRQQYVILQTQDITDRFEGTDTGYYEDEIDHYFADAEA
ncbi:hypothetical protein, partial [Kitasatospora griseola]|uniref:hypothetical protein n=1 Tax=Kitasatospora griseola TaxID=2064 RepID=UPI001E312543